MSRVSHHAHLGLAQGEPGASQSRVPHAGGRRQELAEDRILDSTEKVPLRATYLVDQERKIVARERSERGREQRGGLRVVAALQCGELCPATGARGNRPSCGR